MEIAGITLRVLESNNGDSVRHQISCTTGTFPVGTAVDEGIILDINYFLDYL